jgi:ferredoxin
MGAKLVVDFAKCTGHGRCYNESPALLTYDEEGFVTVRHAPLPLADDQLEDAQAACDACPEQAMTIVNDDERQE